jgi:poly-gamma-glutamate synthesis protein (capsule biosynthesis protein)
MIDCIFTGDVMPGAKVVTASPHPGLSGRFRGADLVVGNLECPVVSEPPAAMDMRKIPLWSDAANLRLLTSFGFTHVSLNNNHIFDLFEKGLDETQSLLDNTGIGAFGIEYGALSQYRRVSVRGVTLGMVAVNWVERQFCGHLSRDLGDLDIGSLKEGCDFLIMFLHWGDDHNIFINRDQQEAARRLIDEGVDLVIGHHPHVTQGYEVYKGKHIFYSLGNFIFTPREEYESLPYSIRYEDCRENVLFQRPECKIGMYVR